MTSGHSAPDAKQDLSLVKVSQPALIRLRQNARFLSLDALRVRARKGGNYLSHFKGRGMEFDEARPYQDGDDPRTIDWRVTARTGRAYTKLFREERERPVFCWVDLRAGMHFATRGRFKSVLASELAVLLAWAAAGRGDRLGGFVFNDADRIELRPALGRRGVLRFIHQLELMDSDQQLAAKDQSDSLAGQMAALRQVVHPGSLVAMMSDFQGLDDEAQSHLRALAKHNDVLMLAIHDPLESELPPSGSYPGAVAGGRRTLVSTGTTRQRWRASATERLTTLTECAERSRARCKLVSTEDDPLAVMQTLMGRVR